MNEQSCAILLLVPDIFVWSSPKDLAIAGGPSPPLQKKRKKGKKKGSLMEEQCEKPLRSNLVNLLIVALALLEELQPV